MAPDAGLGGDGTGEGKGLLPLPPARGEGELPAQEEAGGCGTMGVVGRVGWPAPGGDGNDELPAAGRDAERRIIGRAGGSTVRGPWARRCWLLALLALLVRLSSGVEPAACPNDRVRRGGAGVSGGAAVKRGDDDASDVNPAALAGVPPDGPPVAAVVVRANGEGCSALLRLPPPDRGLTLGAVGVRPAPLLRPPSVGVNAPPDVSAGAVAGRGCGVASTGNVSASVFACTKGNNGAGLSRGLRGCRRASRQTGPAMQRNTHTRFDGISMQAAPLMLAC